MHSYDGDHICLYQDHIRLYAIWDVHMAYEQCHVISYICACWDKNTDQYNSLYVYICIQKYRHICTCRITDAAAGAPRAGAGVRHACTGVHRRHSPLGPWIGVWRSWSCGNRCRPESPWCPRNRWSGRLVTAIWRSQDSFWCKHLPSRFRAQVLVNRCCPRKESK